MGSLLVAYSLRARNAPFFNTVIEIAVSIYSLSAFLWWRNCGKIAPIYIEEVKSHEVFVFNSVHYLKTLLDCFY